MFGLSLFEAITGGVVALGYAILGMTVREFRARVIDFHGRWKEATKLREKMEEEKDEEILELRATVLALEGTYDAEELAEKRKQVKEQGLKDWRARSSRASRIDFSEGACRARAKLRKAGHGEGYVQEHYRGHMTK